MSASGPATWASSPWPERPETDQRCVGYLWVPAHVSFLPAVEAVARGALEVSGHAPWANGEVAAVVLELVADLLPYAAEDRSWLLEVETDDADVFVRIWMRLAAAAGVPLAGERHDALARVTGSYDVHREGTELLIVLQVDIAG